MTVLRARFLRQSTALYRFGRWVRRYLSALGMSVFSVMLVAAVVGVDTQASQASLLFSFLAAFLITAIVLVVWVSRKKLPVMLTRSLPPFATVGTAFTYEITLQNNSSTTFYHWIISDELEETFPDVICFDAAREPAEIANNRFDRIVGYPKWLWLIRKLRGGGVEPVTIEQVPPLSQITVRLTFTPERRGLIEFKSVRLARPEPLGLLLAQSVFDLRGSLTALPKRYLVPRLKLGGTARYQPGGVTLASSIGESGEFVSLRDYRPGDSPRSIHWKSWAKTGKPVVREHQPEFFVRHAMILDTFVPDEQADQFEEAIAVALSFIHTLDTADTLLDLIFVGNQPFHFTIGRGQGQVNDLLKQVASVQVCRDKPFDELSSVVLRRAHEFSGGLVIFSVWDTQRAEFIQRLRRQGLGLMVLVICPDEPTLIEQILSEQAIPLPLGKIQEALSDL